MQKTSLNFQRWLLAQCLRQSPVGHLAQDLKQDLRDSRGPDEPPLPKPFTAAAFLRYLEERGACDGAIRAARDAQSEWRRARSHPALS
jgi:hypothetical protein